MIEFPGGSVNEFVKPIVTPIMPGKAFRLGSPDDTKQALRIRKVVTESAETHRYLPRVHALEVGIALYVSNGNLDIQDFLQLLLDYLGSLTDDGFRSCIAYPHLHFRKASPIRKTGLVQQLPGTIRVKLLVGLMFVPYIAGKVGRQHGIGRYDRLLEHHIGDYFLVNGMGDRLTHPQIIEGGLTGAKKQIVGSEIVIRP